MNIVIEQLPEQKDVAPVERQDDDVSWMELDFVDNDDTKSLLSFAEHCAISVTLGGDDGDGDDDNDEASLSSKEQKPSSFSKPTTRKRPKKTTLPKKSQSFDDTILLGSDKKKKKKKKDKKKSKAEEEDSGELSLKSKRKGKKRASAASASASATTNIADDDSLAESLESLVSAHSGSSKRYGRKGPSSLSPKGRGLVKKMSTVPSRLVKQISFRRKGLKDQLAQSDHVPSDRRGLMGQILYSGFDDDSDSEDEVEFDLH
jgi:hypothetical protein